MRPWISTLSRLLDTASPAVLVTVAASDGSVPRAPGAHMVVTADRTHGSVGGGRLEQRAIEIARQLLVADACPPRLERFALGASLGQCCG
ncbi:MAG: XdhC family protein, partial [Thauera sp.]